MASELKVDKIFNAGGDQDSGINLATNDTIKFDIATSTKATMASTGIVTIVGEGGTTTTNLQQGLAKAWANSSGTGTPAVDDSFNNASVTDNGTGDQTFAFTNNMANANHSCTLAPLSNAIIALVQVLGQSSSNVNLKSHSTSDAADITGKNYSVNGDLA